MFNPRPTKHEPSCLVLKKAAYDAWLRDWPRRFAEPPVVGYRIPGAKAVSDEQPQSSKGATSNE